MLLNLERITLEEESKIESLVGIILFLDSDELDVADIGG